jgi:hypothetical protein
MKKAPDESAFVLFRTEHSFFVLLENPDIHVGGNRLDASVPHRKGEVKATSFLMGFIRL